MDVQLPDGTILRGVPDGTTKADLVAKLKSNGYDTSKLDPAVSAGKAINQATDSFPRQVGLFARQGIEGLGEAAQLVSEPIRYLTDRLTGSTGKTVPAGVLASQFSDLIGLPKPETPTERTVSSANKLLAGTMGTMGVGQLVKGGGAVANKIGEFLTQAPVSQAATATGAGIAGGASKEGGGTEAQQAVASLAGGLAGAGGVGVINSLGNKWTALKNALMTPQQMDVKISQIMQSTGVDYSQVPERARQALRSELGNALRADQELDPAAVARLLDFRRNGLTPTRGMVSLDPVQITREQNLAKMAANSADSELHGLPRIQNQNNQQLINVLNENGAATGNLMTAGNQAIGAIQAKDNALKSGVTAAYDAARSMPGGNTQLDRKPFIDAIYANLAKDNKLAFLPESVSSMLDTISRGTIRAGGQEHAVPFDANALDNLMTTIATAQRGTQDGNVKAALAAVRKALDSTAITPIKPTFDGRQIVTKPMGDALVAADAQAGSFMDALRGAKQAAAQRFGWQESGKPIEAALNDAQPDNFIKRFVIGGTLKDAQDVAANAPVGEVKNAIVNYLKDKALNGASDEVGKFSQSSFNKAIKELGPKLELFFTKDEIDQLQSMGRAASYMQAQPVGSAVNNSNSGALLLGRGGDLLAGLANKLPGGRQFVTDPIQNIAISLRQRQAQNVLPGLLTQQPQTPLLSRFAAPAIAGGGLLAAPSLN